jgi:cyclophilin family peptidyl-prolyl cis-trans isomerase
MMPAMPDGVEITDKVFMDVRISRQDGSTYVRDDLPDTFENRVIKARLTFGLYGKLAPNHVQKFLSYIVSPNDDDVDNPFPSYGRSSFPALDQETGLLQGGTVPSLRVKDIGGATAITYGARVLPAPLWIDPNANKLLSHSTKGLLTHRTLDVTPTFGITTRASPSLDGTHTVFGQILWDAPTLEWFGRLQDLPTYSVERPSGEDEFGTGGVTTAVFNAQREIFRGAAKSLGDTRVSKLYEGKLMRRVEVMQVGKL